MVFHQSLSNHPQEFLFQLSELNLFAKVDLAWGSFVQKFFSLEDTSLIFTCVFLSNLVTRNYLCLNIPFWSGKTFPIDPFDESSKNLKGLVTFPSEKQWLSILENAPNKLITATKQWGVEKPSLMVLDEDRQLYLHKYYHYQEIIAKHMVIRLSSGEQGNDIQPAEKLSHNSRLLIITGGPGTGKTTRVFKELLQHLEMNKKSNILLLAPTGKAAARLRESLISSTEESSHPLAKSVPNETYTIHRFLKGYRQLKKKWDLVVVDEASMVSFPLFYELLVRIDSEFSSISKTIPKLILLGDKDQLSSVEEGSLFYELVTTDGDVPDPLMKQVVTLKKNFRYPPDSPIGKTARAITENQEPLKIFLSYQCHSSSDQEDLKRNFVYFPKYHLQDIEKIVKTQFIDHWRDWFQLTEEWRHTITETTIQEYQNTAGIHPTLQNILQKLFDLYKKQIILCAYRHGIFGYQHLNKMIPKWLQEENLLRINPVNDFIGHGQPIMVGKNNYHIGVFNGDIGIALYSHHQRGRIDVYFEGQQESHPPHAIGPHELAYAFTIHKSQGSEFEKVMVVFGHSEHDFLSREICYTAITRARHKVIYLMDQNMLEYALARKSIRHSGLRRQLVKTYNEIFVGSK